ncbi:MAG: hypothetical protein LUC25_07665 [Ruminococcus sp.]|nr:hypothetical protein [Ruminococcus sp.]
MEKYRISVLIDDIEIPCEKAVIKRSAKLSHITTASNGVVTRNMGAARKFISLSGKLLSEDYEYLSDLLEESLTSVKTVCINDKEYSNAHIYDFEINLNSGEKLGSINIELYVNDE